MLCGANLFFSRDDDADAAEEKQRGLDQSIGRDRFALSVDRWRRLI